MTGLLLLDSADPADVRGADALTLPWSVLRALADDEVTDAAVEELLEAVPPVRAHQEEQV